MIDAPRLEQRPARPYVAIRRTVAIDGFPAAFDECFPRLVGWMHEHSVTPAGPGMVRYRSDDERGYDIDMAFPIDADANAEAGSGEVFVDALPPGRYAVVTNTGPFDGVAEAHGALDEWISARRLVQDVEGGARVEIYVTDPRLETDPSRLRVDVEQLLA